MTNRECPEVAAEQITLDDRRTDLEYGKEILKAAQHLRDRVRAELGQSPVPRDPAAPASSAP